MEPKTTVWQTTVWQWMVTLSDDRTVIVTAPRSLILEGGLVFRGLPHEKERVGNLIAAFASGDWRRVQLVSNPFDKGAVLIEPVSRETQSLHRLTEAADV